MDVVKEDVKLAGVGQVIFMTLRVGAVSFSSTYFGTSTA